MNLTEKKIGHDESAWLVKWLRTQKGISVETFDLKSFVKKTVSDVIAEAKKSAGVNLTEKDVLVGLRRIM